MDEADRILNMDFEVELDKILRVIPQERRTYMFSATMTKKVEKLQRASLKDPVKVEVSTKYTTVEKLLQYYIFIPLKFKVIPTQTKNYYVKVTNDHMGVLSGCLPGPHSERTCRKFFHGILRHLCQCYEDGTSP